MSLTEIFGALVTKVDLARLLGYLCDIFQNLDELTPQALILDPVQGVNGISRRKMQKPISSKLQKQRLTIGLLTYGVEDYNNNAIWSGVADVVQEQGANLLCFPGKPLHSPIRFHAQANIIYDLIDPEYLDGLVIWAGALAHHASTEEVQAFCERYQPLPMVSVSLQLVGIPSVVPDYNQNIREAISHLVETHGCRRIAYIRGPEGHPGPEMRYRAYVEMLAE